MRLNGGQNKWVKNCELQRVTTGWIIHFGGHNTAAVMRVHSLVAPKYNHYASMSGAGFKNLTVYRGKGGALLTPGRKKALKGAAVAAAMLAAAVGANALKNRAGLTSIDQPVAEFGEDPHVTAARNLGIPIIATGARY